MVFQENTAKKHLKILKKFLRAKTRKTEQMRENTSKPLFIAERR